MTKSLTSLELQVPPPPPRWEEGVKNLVLSSKDILPARPALVQLSITYISPATSRRMNREIVSAAYANSPPVTLQQYGIG